MPVPDLLMTELCPAVRRREQCQDPMCTHAHYKTEPLRTVRASCEANEQESSEGPPPPHSGPALRRAGVPAAAASASPGALETAPLLLPAQRAPYAQQAQQGRPPLSYSQPARTAELTRLCWSRQRWEQELEELFLLHPAPPAQQRAGDSVAAASLGAREMDTSAKGNGGIPDSAAGQAGDVTKHRVARTKISSKDFKQFDIDPDAILRGADKRTTVMVRHLHGFCGRRDFLSLLEQCGLGNRYSFFYMPFKRHQKVLAGFAFLDFASPQDVHTLHGAVASGLWREVCGQSPARSPAVSYARFQGHEELVQHFSLSTVLQDRDPEMRPIFRPEVASQCQAASQSTSVDGPMEAMASRQGYGLEGLACERAGWSRLRGGPSAEPLLLDDGEGWMRQESTFSTASTSLGDDADDWKRQQSSTSTASALCASGPALEGPALEHAAEKGYS